MESTLISLAWQTNFGAEKVSAYEIAYRINGSPWQALADFQPADINRYEFNIRAHDTFGNVEDWQEAGVVSSTIVSSRTRDEYKIQKRQP